MNATDLRKGVFVAVDGELYVVVDFEHVTPGKGQAVMQTKLRHIKAGHHVNKRFRSNEKVEQVFLDTHEMEYLYRQGDQFCFMDTKTYEQVMVAVEIVGDAAQFMRHNETVRIVFYENRPITLNLPAAVALEVTDTEPGAKGDSVTNVYKPATLETGLTVRVPLFIQRGERVKVDTRTGEFLERVG
ncbi:MAG: elongation factor P [Planctomycetes bacterium]|nr:elongation factor P [Planctomycetota bacterium]